jgi:Bacterial PH domain
MAFRDKMRAQAAPLLQPGEQIEAIIGAQTKSQWFALISYWIIALTNGYRVIVVTDRRILVTTSGRFSMTVKDVARELPRSVRIGPVSGLWARCDTLGERLYIHKRFHKDVAAADSVTA